MNKTEIMVEFSISGDNLIPEIITQKLGITPTEQWTKGEEVEGRSYPRRHSNWSIGTEYEVSMDIDDQLKKIYELLRSKLDILRELREEYRLEYQIGIIPRIMNNGIPSLHFDRWFLEFANNIEATIDIDLVNCEIA